MTVSRAFTLIVLALVLTLLAGCGGSDPGTGTDATGTVGIQVDWPELAEGEKLLPSLSQSIRVTITPTLGGARQRTVVLNRPETEVLIEGVPAGEAILRATAHPELNGAGVPQAGAAQAIVVEADQLNDYQMTLDSTIDEVVMVPDTLTLGIGQQAELSVAAYDAQGRIVLAAYDWQVDPANPVVDFDEETGEVTGLRLGQATVRATETDTGMFAEAEITVVADDTYLCVAVFDEDGDPVTDAMVAGSDGSEIFDSVPGESPGLYCLPDAPRGALGIAVGAEGYRSVHRAVTYHGGDQLVEVHLEEISELVTDECPEIGISLADFDEGLGVVTALATVQNIDTASVLLFQDGDPANMAAVDVGTVPFPTFRHEAFLRSGENRFVVFAGNANCAVLSLVEIQQWTPGEEGDFYFRVTLTWDTATDLDLHTWSPNNEHSWYGNREIDAGRLDRDVIAGYGPENFTCDNLVPGRYHVAVNSYSIRGSYANARIRVMTGGLAASPVLESFGPYEFTHSNANSGYPVVGDTDSWWRPCDIILGEDGSVEIVPPDDTPLELNPTAASVVIEKAG